MFSMQTFPAVVGDRGVSFVPSKEEVVEGQDGSVRVPQQQHCPSLEGLHQVTAVLVHLLHQGRACVPRLHLSPVPWKGSGS